MQVTTKVTIIVHKGKIAPLERMLIEMLDLAIKDFRIKRYREDVVSFCNSVFFENVIDHLNRNPQADREKILSGKARRIARVT